MIKATEMSQEAAQEQTPPAVETTPAAEVITETTPTDEAAKPFYSKYGEFESEEQFDSFVNQAKEIIPIKDQITQQQKEYEERIKFLSEVDQDPDPEISTISAFKKRGIGIDIATKVISSDASKLEENPLDALILAEAVSNPAKYSKLGRQGVEEAIREKYNLPSEGEYTPTALMRSEAIDAIEKINNIKAEVSKSENPITFAKAQIENNRASFKTKVDQSSKTFEKVVDEIDTIVEKHDDVEISFKVSKEDRQWLASQKDAVAAQFAHLSDSEREAQMKTYLTSMFKVQRYMNGDVLKAFKEKYAANAQREATREVLNGQPVTPVRVTDTAQNKEESPFAIEAKKRGLK